ncbi:MAG TPA: AMP-binding protein, partial [Bacteroidales bacterium]|nr:AMP-binding protein [Bacteroidales bacterium]
MSQLTIRHLLINSFQQFADLDALSYVDSPAITYRELYQKVFTLSVQLKGIGITKGDKIAILSGNGPNWGISYLATVCMGAVVVPILNDFSKNEIQNILNHSETKVLFISKNLLHKMGNEGYEFVKHIINIEDFSANTSFESFALPFPDPSNTDFSTANIDELFGTLEDDALASIIYTSGTTGQSKGVMLSHKNLMSNMQNTSRIQPITPNDRLLSVLPLSHTYECTLGFLLPLSSGGQIFYFKGAPVPSVLLPALKTIRPTMMLTVPLIIEKIYRNKIQPVVSKGLMKYLFHFPPTRKAFSYMVGLKLKKTFGKQLHFFGIGGALLDA